MRKLDIWDFPWFTQGNSDFKSKDLNLTLPGRKAWALSLSLGFFLQYSADIGMLP